MFLLAIVVFGVTAWFLGTRYGWIAALVSAASILAAMVIPKTAIAIYALHILWVGGLVYFGPKVMKMRRPQMQKGGWRDDANRLVRRGLALWKMRK